MMSMSQTCVLGWSEEKNNSCAFAQPFLGCFAKYIYKRSTLGASWLGQSGVVSVPATSPLRGCYATLTTRTRALRGGANATGTPVKSARARSHTVGRLGE